MAGSNTVEHKLRLLIETELDEKQKQQVGKQLKDILGGAVIGFDEAETKKNITPIIRMIQKLFNKAEMKFDADKLLGMPSQEALRKVAEITASEFQTAFDRALAKSGGIKIDFGNVDLSGMTEPLERITEELVEINRKIANETKKSVEDIDSAIKRLNKAKPKKINAKIMEDGVEKEVQKEVNKVEQTVSKIEKTLNSVNNRKALSSEKTAVSALGAAADNYRKSLEKGDPWEVQYQHLVSFVSKYESLTKKIKPVIDANHSEFKELYDVLAPKAGAAKVSLEDFVNVARGSELAEYKNQPWARESTLKKIEQTLKNGISVKDGGGDDKPSEPTQSEESIRKEAEASEAARKAAEERRIAEEKAAKAARKAAEAKKITVYRGIVPPEDESLDRRGILDENDGSEWWATNKNAAQTYADMDEGGVILVGTVSPKNPLVIDAGGRNYDDFAKMPGIQNIVEQFPELKELIDTKADITDVQKYINTRAKELGHDAVQFDNVNDVLNPRAFKEIGATFAVLDDNILNVSGAFAQLEYDFKEGLGDYTEKATADNIPDYYKPPVPSSIEAESAAHQENTEAIIAETQAMEKLNSEKAEGLQMDSKDDVAVSEKPAVAVEPVEVGTTSSAIQTEELKNLLSAITYNVKVIQDSSFNDDSKASVSIDAEELKNVLNAITYNVKIAYDDADKTANKIALDDSILESTLTKVFANILNPKTQQNDSEQKQSPWALENTLQAVKGILDNIQANTAKFGTVEISNVDAIAGTTLESKLTEIKSVLESIDGKIAKGGVINTRGAVKQAYANSQKQNAASNEANMFKSLQKDYESMGKLAAKFAKTENLETKAQLENIKEAIARKRQSIKLTMEENSKLRERYNIAFNAEKRLLDAAEAQREVNAQRITELREEAQLEKEAEKAWKKQVKDAQRATGINAATTAANAGDKTVLSAIGTEGISKDVENKAKELSVQIKELRNLRDNIDKMGSEASDEERESLGKQIEKVKELKKEVDGYLKIHEKYSGEGVSDLGDASNFGAVGTDQYWNNITAAIKNASAGRVTINGMNTDTGELTGTTKIAANTFAQWSATVDPITGKLSMLRTGIKKTETLVEAITRKTKEIFTYFSGSSIIFKVFNELKKGVQYVREIDVALTELKKVTDETEETYREFLDTAAKTAAKVGSTIKDVVSSTADWARLGYSMEQAAKFAETTQILMNVSEFTDVSQATDTLISAVQAFGYTAETSMDVVDMLNTIGNNYAISTADLAQSLTKSSASLVAAGGDLAEAAALTATANKIIQDADSVGTALKTTSLRLRGTEVSVLEEEGLDSEGAVTSKSKLQGKVKSLSGVDILTATGEYKSTYEILSEIADVWEKIDDMDQAALLELISGKRNSSVIAAILQNPEELKEAFEDANNASGSALKENEKYLDSIQGKIDQFNNATQAMWSNALDSDVIKDIVELGTWLIKAIDKVGLLNSALITLATISMIKNKQGPIAFLQSISDMITGAASKVKGFVSSFSSATTATSELTAATIEQAVANNTITASEAIRQATTNGLVLSQISLTDAEAMAALSTTTLNEAEKQAIINKLGLTSAATTLTMATLGQAVAEGKITAAEAAHLGVATGLMAAQTSLTSIKAAEILTSQGLSAAHAEELAAKLGLTAATSTLNAVKVQQLMIDGILTPAEGALALSLLATGGAATTAATGFAALWTALWPILAVMAGAAVIWAIVKGIDALITTTEEHTEKLDDMKSELRDIQSELDSVNSELKTTKERMAELIAMPSLSFTEQEELNRLKEENEELERRERLLKAQEEREKKRVAEQAVKTVESQLSDTSYTGSIWDAVAVGIEGALAGAAAGAAIGSVVPVLGTAVGAIAGAIGGAGGAVGVELLANRISTEDKLDQEIENYKKLVSQKEELEKKLETASDEGTGLFGWGESEYEKTNKELEKIKQEINETETYIDGVIKQMGENLNGVEYGYGADEVLSFYDNLQYKFEIARGTIGAESDAIANIFNRPEYEATYNEIKRLQGELEKDPGNETYLEQISEQCKKAEDDLIAVGLSADKAFDYFTMKSGSSVDDIMAQYKVAKTALEDLKSGAISIDDLVKYDEEKNKATSRPDAIAEKLQGVSPEVREQFASIVEAIKEGSYDTEDGLTNWDAAIKKLELQGMQAVIENVKTELEAANKLAFPDLEISGWIDSVDELKGAFESLASSMDLIVTAQEQMNSSGQISMKTALGLMEATDDWNQILEVNNGVITMNANAEQILIQSKLDLIKANIEMALQQVETDIALMEGAINSTKAGNAFTQGFTKALTNAQGVLVGLKAGWDAFWSGQDVASAFNNAYKYTVDNLTPDESSLGELYAQRDKLQKQRDMLTSVDTTQEFKDNYDFDKNPGDKYGDSEDDAFQKEMDYWENRIAANQAKSEQVQNEIDLLESKGQKADTSFYEELISLENEHKSLLEQQKSAAEAHLATFEEGSEEWWEVANTLNDIEGELDDVTASIVDFQDAIGEIDTYKFEEFNNRLDNMASKLETIRNLIAPNGEEDWFDDEGNWTEAGVAVLGSHIQDLENYKQGYQNTVDELVKYESPYAGNESHYEALGIHSEQEYYDKVEELTNQQYQFAESTSDTKQSIVDMYESSIDAVEEYIDTLIDGYNDYIDSVKEALDAERDLYDFKKNVHKQAKDIAELERRIASLSGSTNAADIAERRKLEAQLYESRESLNDTYYDHAQESQQNALDAEQEAYEETMTKFVEGLRTSLDEATANMDEFLMGVTSMVMYNADTVLAKYEETNLPLTKELTNPWEEAKKAVGNYSGDALDLMNQWTKEGGFFAQFNVTGTENLQSPWSAGTTAANAFKSSVDTAMDNVVDKISSNVQEASGQLSNLYQQIKDTEVGAVTAANNIVAANAASNSSTSYTPTATPSSKSMHHVYSTVKDIVIGSQNYLDQNTKTIDGVKYYLQSSTGYYYKISDLKKKKYDGGRTTGWAIPAYTSGYSYYAKGTTGTTRDEWALTDEPRFGDELVLVPGKDGNLSFMRKGTSVVPADLTANLMEWGQLTPDAMNLGGGVNVNMINNAVNKPEFNFAFDALVKAENITEETLPAVRKLVTQELDRFTRELNYALKGKGAR